MKYIGRLINPKVDIDIFFVVFLSTVVLVGMPVWFALLSTLYYLIE